jgi:hypothetical protein
MTIGVESQMNDSWPPGATTHALSGDTVHEWVHEYAQELQTIRVFVPHSWMARTSEAYDEPQALALDA